jgi:hypothetical protein
VNKLPNKAGKVVFVEKRVVEEDRGEFDRS